MGRFRYSRDGSFLDERRLLSARLENGNCSTKILAAGELLRLDETPDGARRALRAAEEALAGGTEHQPDWAASGHRVLGEALERLSQPAEALNAYERALALDPKIGVSRRAKMLRKELGRG